MKIGILGGTFNPIHFGHLFVSNYVMEELKLDEIVFIPSGNPPHKKDKSVIDKIHRKKMAELAIKDSDSFKIDYFELEKEGYSYAYDTVIHLKEQNPNDRLYYIIGQDAFFLMDTWYRYEEFLKLVDFVIVSRGDELREKIIEKYSKFNPSLTFLSTPVIEISSTQIRKRIKQNKSIAFYLPKEVEEYIRQKNLYI